MKDILTIHSETIAEKIAVIEDPPGGESRQLTFAELETCANRLARVLQSRGAGPGTKVVWLGQNSVSIVVMMHAARKIGAIAVPLNYRLSNEEAAYVIDNSDAEIIFSDAEYTGLLQSIRKDIPGVRDILVFDGEAPGDMLDVNQLLDGASGEAIDPEFETSAGTMIYTSGTTGKPKGAVRMGEGDPDAQAQLLAEIGYRQDDIYLTTGPLYHSGPGGFMAIAHALGNTVVLQRKFSPEDWLRLVDRYRITSSFSAPTPIRLVCNLDEDIKSRYDVSSIRIMIANAAPWSYALKLAYLAYFPETSLFEVYGSTELGVNTILRPEYQKQKKGSCGKPAPGVEITLIDESGKEVTTPRVPGELYVRSRNMYSTYYKAEEKYEEDRRGDMHTVGDIAYFDEDGFYYICDRKKDMIISGGMNIYPAEIEAALEHHDDILDVAVFGIPSEQWGESVHAVVVTRSGSDLDEAGVIEFSREHLASYKIPRSVSFVEDIPRNGSGKILKRELRAPYWKDHESNVL